MKIFDFPNNKIVSSSLIKSNLSPFNGTETWSPGHNGGDARVILKYCYPDWNNGGWPRQESYFNQRYFWVNGEFTPRETMRGKMALLGYLYAIR